LAIDEANRPTVIEYKVNEDASPSALVQALSYAYYLQKNQEYFGRLISRRLGNVKDEDLDFDNLRIVLVARGFDSHVQEAAQMVDPHVKLVDYSIYKTPEVEAMSTSIVYDSTSTRGPVGRGAYSIDWHFSGRYVAMKATFEKLTSEIKAQLNVKPYFRKDFIAFKRNYIFVDVHVYTDRLELGLTLPEGTSLSSRFLRPPEGRFTSRVTYLVKVQGPKEIDEELMIAIAQAYRTS
jgi:predicted transport protein